MRHVLVTALAASLLGACGSPAVVAGTVGPNTFDKAKTAWFGPSVIILLDEDVPCDQMGFVRKQYVEGSPADSRRSFTAVQIAFRNEITEGPFMADRAQGVSVDGLVNTSDDLDVLHAREGTVTIDGVSGGSVSGSLSVAFADSGVAAEFDAKSCVNVP